MQNKRWAFGSRRGVLESWSGVRDFLGESPTWKAGWLPRGRLLVRRRPSRSGRAGWGGALQPQTMHLGIWTTLFCGAPGLPLMLPAGKYVLSSLLFPERWRWLRSPKWSKVQLLLVSNKRTVVGCCSGLVAASIFPPESKRTRPAQGALLPELAAAATQGV